MPRLRVRGVMIPDVMTDRAEAADAPIRVSRDAQPRPTLPAIVWIVDDEVAAPGFVAAVRARFPGETIELVTLKGPLARLMRPDA